MSVFSKVKIGLITSHRIPNHGSFLQAWSLCEYLNEQGYNIEIIDYIYPNLYHLNYVQHNEIKRDTDTSTKIKRLKRYLIDRWFVCNRKRGFELIIYNILNLVLQIPNNLYFRQLKLSDKSFISQDELKKSKLDYDILLSGSDQIWNPRFAGEDSTFFLQFGGNNIRRVAYSSSFGISVIESKYQQQYAKWLKTYSNISTREQTGTEIVQHLTGKNAVHVLDPVMLFDKARWNRILALSGYDGEGVQPYIVSYCLDYVYKGVIDYADNVMQKIANAKKLKCETLYKSNLPGNIVKPHKETIHPFEFVKTIMHADFALVSSFHGLAFCILFHTPFVVIMSSIDNIDSRLSDLLATFNLKERMLIVGEEFDATQIKDIDWKQVDEIYQMMVHESKQYLKNALK